MRIPITVTLVHVLIVIAAVYIQPTPIKMAPRRPVVVKTTVLAKEQYKKAVAQIPSTPLPPLPVEPEPEPMVEPEAAEVAAQGPNHLPPDFTPQEPPTPLPRPTPKAEPTPRADPPPRGDGRIPKVPSEPLKLVKAEKPKTKTPAKTAAKTPAKKAVAQKTTKPKGESKPKKEASSPNRDQLIAMMQKSLNTLQSTSTASGKGSSKGGSTKSSTSSSSPLVGTLASETLSFEAQYEVELVSYLEALLSFPEKGDVKVKLTLNRTGSVQTVEILKASSQKNRNYIENSLASCSFPAFGSHFKGETAHTFTLNLTSENSR